MNIAEFQQWLAAHGQPLVADGAAGPKTRDAIVAAFTNPHAPPVSGDQVAMFAVAIGCTEKQLRAIAKVESGGAAFDAAGRPKILFERHYFHRLTEGRWSIAPYSDAKPGGYAVDSWTKLVAAACRDPSAAFQSASWGKFQIMGAHWQALNYASPLEMAWAMREGEAGHYEALVRFLKANRLCDAARRLSTNPADNKAFAAGYNGPEFRKYSYDEKLAEAMK